MLHRRGRVSRPATSSLSICGQKTSVIGFCELYIAFSRRRRGTALAVDEACYIVGGGFLCPSRRGLLGLLAQTSISLPSRRRLQTLTHLQIPPVSATPANAYAFANPSRLGDACKRLRICKSLPFTQKIRPFGRIFDYSINPRGNSSEREETLKSSSVFTSIIGKSGGQNSQMNCLQMPQGTMYSSP